MVFALFNVGYFRTVWDRSATQHRANDAKGEASLIGGSRANLLDLSAMKVKIRLIGGKLVEMATAIPRLRRPGLGRSGVPDGSESRDNGHANPGSDDRQTA